MVVGISGASGSILARTTIDELLLRDVPTILVCTNAARLVWQDEMDTTFGEVLSEWQEHPLFAHYPMGDMRASIASGTFPTSGMAVVPCSMNSIAAMAHGLANNLLLRAADVCLKERRKLVIVPRETPLHSTHLENMLSLSKSGAIIMPPDPAFYLRPNGMEDIARFVALRILIALGIEEELPAELQYHDDAAAQ